MDEESSPVGPAATALLSDRDALQGGYYELSVQLGPRSDARLASALDVLHHAACINGPWQRFFDPDARLSPATWSIAALTTGSLLGLVNPTVSGTTLCVVGAVTEDSGEDELHLALPLEALSRIEPGIGSFPFGEDGGEASLTWRRPYDTWLADVGRAIYNEVPYTLAAIGWETSGTVDADVLAADPASTSAIGLLIPSGQQVRYLPATR